MTKKKTGWVDEWIKAFNSPEGQLFAAAIKVVEEEEKEEKRET